MWKNDSIGGKRVEKTSFFVPVVLNGIEKEVYMQFDLGANITQLYGNTINAFISKDPDLKNEISIIKEKSYFTEAQIKLNQNIWLKAYKLRIINSRHILETELDYDNFEKTDKENLIKQKKAVLEKYDILTYTTGANIGRTNVYLKDDLAIGSNHVNILRVDRNPIYVGFVMNSIVGRYQTVRLATGTAQAELYPSDVNTFEIPFIKQADIEKIEGLLLESFENGIKSKGLIKLSRQAVDLAIEKGEKEAIKLIEKYKDE